MKNFKFLSKNILYQSIYVEYTMQHNSKNFTHLRFAERDQTENNPNIKEYRGKFLDFKRMVDNHERLNWFHNKPVIHLIAFYSERFNNCQRLGYLDFFKRNCFRFGKNQKIKVYYEII